MKKILLALLGLFVTTGNLYSQNITIVMFDNNNNTVKQELVNEIKKAYNKANVSFITMGLPRSSYHAGYKRHRADSLLKSLNRLNRGFVMGITSKDISTTKGNYQDWGVFGLGSRPLKAGIVSSHRLGTTTGVVSTVLHELGHMFALPHCPDENCLMADKKGKLGKITYKMCNNCRNKLIL